MLEVVVVVLTLTHQSVTVLLLQEALEVAKEAKLDRAQITEEFLEQTVVEHQQTQILVVEVLQEGFQEMEEAAQAVL
jgi:hypothetical protein